jgi:alkylation response protein AidB-like acyl-CoA dehydrogenase
VTVETPTGVHPVPDQHGVNLFEADRQLRELLPVYLPADLCEHLLPALQRLGDLAGARLDELAALADRNPPTLSHRSRSGLDEQRIEKHPAYVEMERIAFGDYGLAAISHRDGVLGFPGRMPPIAKYVLTYLFVQAEFGLCCPVSMTDSLSRTLQRYGSRALIDRFLPRLTSLDPDTLFQGAMFMTEQGAGSDVAATAMRAMADPDVPGAYRLEGEKWFCSNPDADLAMVLARIDGAPPGMQGVSLFLLPRRLDDGCLNRYRIVRLKDKLGTRSMASGEIRFEGALAFLVGEPGRGFVQMADMVNNSRLSNGVRAAGLMRRAVSEAFFVARHRSAFGRLLVDLPLMRRQLSKILLPAEQARTMMFQTAAALARADHGDGEAYRLLRILTPIFKFRACRDARRVTGDAMEVRGGCGYIEEWPDPRLVRDAHLGSIWEGTSNIVALDVVRAIRRERALDVLESQWAQQLEESRVGGALRAHLDATIARTLELADEATRREGLTRRAASSLYNLTSAVAMLWESARGASPARAGLAALVLRHRLDPEDPLDAAPDADEAFDEVSSCL